MTNYIPLLMNSSFIIQIVVVMASILLGMLLYPRLKKIYADFIIKLYTDLGTEKSKEEKAPKLRKEETSSIIGNSKTIIGHSRTKTSISVENENVIEKEHTFASETSEDHGLMDDIDIPLDKVENLTEEEFNPDEEAMDLETEKGAVLASGASYDELMTTEKALTKEQLSIEEKEKAGRILYENESTEIVEQAISNDEKILTKVNALIHFHVKRHNITLENNDESDNLRDIEDFDVKQIF